MARPRTSDMSLSEQIAAMEADILKKKKQLQNRRTEIVAWLGGVMLRELRDPKNDRLRAYINGILDGEVGLEKSDKMRVRNRRLVEAIRLEIEAGLAEAAKAGAKAGEVA